MKRIGKEYFGQYCQIRSNLVDFCDMALEEANDMMRSAMSQAANIVAETARQNLVQDIKGATQPLPEGGTLYSGIRAFTWKQSPSATVHIYGNMKTNDGTWRLRFYEGGTKKRWLKSQTEFDTTTKEVRNRNGRGTHTATYKRKKNKKYLGRLKEDWFFKRAVESSEPQVDGVIQATLTTKLSDLGKQAKWQDMLERNNLK